MKLSQSTKQIMANSVIYLVILVFCTLVIAPIAWFAITSLKTPAKVVAYPPSWIPKPFTVDNYIGVIRGSNMPRYFFNSIFVAFSTIAVTLVLASHVSYAAARFHFRFKNIILFLILATSMIPGICILPSLYMIAVGVKLHDTYLVLILVFCAWQIPAIIWLLKGFFEDLPKELEEAARIDGYSTLGIFYRIVLPISKPGFAAGGILIFINVWNDWLIAVTLTISEEMRLAHVGLFNYVRDLGVEWGKFTAYTMLSIIPVVAFFLIMQKHFITGLVAGATKG